MSNKNTANQDYSKNCDDINSMFIEQWEQACLGLPGGGAKLSRYMPVVYRRWYFSTLAENSLLSPANLIHTHNKQSGVSEMRTPRLRVKRGGAAEPEFSTEDFEKGHPFIRDLRMFLDKLDFAFDIDLIKRRGEEGFFDCLSLSDDEYLDFLYHISINLKLVRVMPSLGKAVSTVNGSYASFFDNTEDFILKRAVDAVADICLDTLREILPLKRTFRQKLLSYAKATSTMDGIFSDMFYDSGIDIFELLEDLHHNAGFLFKKIEDLAMEQDGDSKPDAVRFDADEESMQAELMAGVFLLGVSLDRRFVTPLSYYLRVVQPLYVVPYNVKEDLYSLNEASMERLADKEGSFFDDASPLVYAPCSVFSPTLLGQRILGIERIDDKDSVYLPEDLPVAMILATLRSKANGGIKIPITYRVVTMKIHPADDKRRWKNVRLPGEMSVEDLHEFVCDIFGMDSTRHFSLYVGANENPFAEYTNKPANKRSRAKRPSPDGVPLTELPLTEGAEFLYVLRGAAGSYSFLFRVMKLESTRQKVFFPRVTRSSARND